MKTNLIYFFGVVVMFTMVAFALEPGSGVFDAAEKKLAATGVLNVEDYRRLSESVSVLEEGQNTLDMTSLTKILTAPPFSNRENEDLKCKRALAELLLRNEEKKVASGHALNVADLSEMGPVLQLCRFWLEELKLAKEKNPAETAGTYSVSANYPRGAERDPEIAKMIKENNERMEKNALSIRYSNLRSCMTAVLRHTSELLRTPEIVNSGLQAALFEANGVSKSDREVLLSGRLPNSVRR